MSLHRRAAKTDQTQAGIVRALRAYGVQVWVIKQPCDLLCYYWSNPLQRFVWQPLEVKTPYGKRRPRARKRSEQETQNEFLAQTSTPIVTSWQEAICALGIACLPPLTSAACTSKPISPPTSSVGNR